MINCYVLVSEKTELQPSPDEAQKAAARALEDHGGGLQGPNGTTEVVPAQVNGPLLKIPGGPHHQKQVMKELTKVFNQIMRTHRWPNEICSNGGPRCNSDKWPERFNQNLKLVILAVDTEGKDSTHLAPNTTIGPWEPKHFQLTHIHHNQITGTGMDRSPQETEDNGNRWSLTPNT